MDHPGPLTGSGALIGAVARFAATLEPGPVCVALSGGADSLALTASAVRAGLSVHALIVDHRLQAGSAEVAAAAANTARALGATAEVVEVQVRGPGGMEAAARDARYRALDAHRARRPVLLGHTLDDQAETVLLGLGRGSGARSLAGMAAWSAPWGRPFLRIRRSQTRQACVEWGLPVWDDPHNDDPRFTRVRVRREVLPLLDEVLSGGVAQALANTADQLRDDAEVLDELAGELLRNARLPDRALSVPVLAVARTALRTRALRVWLIELGARAPSRALIDQVDALVSSWHGQGAVAIGGDADVRSVVVRRKSALEPDTMPR